MGDARHRWVASKLADSFGADQTKIENQLFSQYKQALDDFMEPTGPVSLTFFYQVPEVETTEGEYVLKGDQSVLFLTTGEADKLRGKAVYFVRATSKAVAATSVEQDITCGEVAGSALDSFRALVMDLFIPILKEQQHPWGKNSEENTGEFMSGAAKFASTLTEAVNSLHGGVELRKPDRKYVDSIELSPKGFTKAAGDTEQADHFEGIIDEWCQQVERLLEDGEANRKDADDAGPDTELEFWRNRMAKFNSITEQLKSKECRLVLGVSQAGRGKGHRNWKTVDMKVTDAANEAKDNVKYLTTLEKSLEPMYSGTPNQIIDSLPALLNNIKMMHTIARYYNTTERMTTLFVKVTNQIITNCKNYITTPGKLWDQDKQKLITALEVVAKVNEAYQEQYRLTRDRLQSQPKGKQFDFNEQKIFGKLELFVKRCNKLIDMFTTVHQFSTLAQHTHIEGLGDMIKNFFGIVDEFTKKPYDLLDYMKNQFDRDFLEFNVNINDLETALQGFINSSFENITSTEHALNLLRQFQSILQRDSLKADLDDKYMVIFQNYGLDLDAVQKIYEKHKAAPPVPRNAPPVAGNIMWARQLLRRIEEPMKKFMSIGDDSKGDGTKGIMNSKESKRIVKTYNRVARALIEFETLWHQAWMKSIENAKAGLQATLIVRHPDTGALLVNFDKEIMQLMRETKYLLRMGVEVPESAKMVLLQEDKFKYYFNQLSYALREYDRVMAGVLVIAKPLLGPHLDDLDKKLQPGMYILTWTSMNIDGYLHRIHNGLARLEELIRKINDIIDNRVEANLKFLSKMVLVDLPGDRSFTYEDFASTQTRYIKKQTDQMVVLNKEVERAVNELCDIVAMYPRENVDVPLADSDVAMFKKHYSKLMYQAILKATKASFNVMKKRLGSRQSGGFLFVERPFFDVDVELTIPNVSMNPSLEDIQAAINSTAKKVLRCSLELELWGDTDAQGKLRTFYEIIAADKEIVKSVLLLTGSIEGTKMQVLDYIATFSKYDFLWKRDMQAEYAEFMHTNPSIEDFEVKLRDYMAVENEIKSIPPVHNIGALSLETQPMKDSLKSEALSWKNQYAKNLAAQGHDQLTSIYNYMRDTTFKLGKKPEDLDDVRVVMEVLKEVREKEAEIDHVMTPIEELYALLSRYEVRVPKEELDQVSDLHYSWKKLRKLSGDVSDNLARLQVGYKRELIKSVKLFVADVQNFRADFETQGPMVSGLEPMEAVDRLRKFQQMFDVRKRKWDGFSSGEGLFGLPITPYPELEKTEKEIVNLDKLYSLYQTVLQTINGYAEIHWVEVVQNIDAWMENVNNLQAQCKKLPKSLRDWPAFMALKKKIDDFLEILPLLQSLSSKAMRNRHWQQLMAITGKQLNLAEDVLKLQHLLEADLLATRDEVEELCSAATKEEQIEVKLAAIAEEWSDMNLDFANYKNRGLVILKAAEMGTIIERLEDGQMSLGSMATNRYSAPFREDVMGWIVKLSTVSEVIEMWLQVQNMWMYMEAVFSGGDIAKQLPQEAKRFQNIDKNYMKIVTNAIELRNVVQTCYGNELMKNLLPHLTEQLELCQKSLSAYLETKRAAFPRFYFVSDPTLLEILSLGSDPVAVQPHFQSGLFDAVSAVTFDKVDKLKMLEMHSTQGERVSFINAVTASGNIEDWLQRLVNGMQETIKTVIRRAHQEVNDKGLEDFIFGYPAQIALLGIQFQWTMDMNSALSQAKNDKSIMSKAMKKTDSILKEMVTMTTKDLGKMARTNLETCVTVHVHQRDTSEDLLKKKIKEPTDFEWLKQCRFYWREDKNTVIISICDVDFEYSYEYLGVKERLVITPLTDICYVTLSQALGMCLGGAPAGPAGTGKTETTKDLGNTLGKFVVVFNCSDQMDYKGMGKIYKGLAQSGLWGCFDEFNRINLDVLSVCAQQVFCVLSAIRDRKSSFVFTDGQVVSLDLRVAFFITMNPGYAGRQELPENLKSLFRGVTMMVPNRQIIKKVKLAACGYQENEMLAKKFFVLYGLCEQQLSKQAHYDFGLRNILSVLRTAGASKRANPDKSETFLMMRTLRDMNMSKFVAEDVPLFLSLIEDLFPGMKADKATFPDVEGALRKQVRERGLQEHPTWLGKCIQLYETYLVRHGIMLVGPTGGGKTAIADCLAGALSELGIKHIIWRMNPKAITAPQMFGRMDQSTGDWTDGIFAVLWRKAAKNRNQNTWICLDGPVDAIWIENLNTVLDDNKVLTLANGDRIPMIPNMKAFFEPENLSNASPATVSRAGIIYVSDTELGWKPVVASWLQKRRAQEMTALKPHFDKYVGDLLDYTRLNLRPTMPNQEVCQVGTLLTLLEACLKPSTDSNEVLSDGHYERLFMYCLTWSLGGLLTIEDRKKFSAQMYQLGADNLPKLEDAAVDTPYEYFVNEDNTEWEHWSKRVPAWVYPKEVEKPKYAQLVIPTLDSVRFEQLLQLVASINRATCLIGGPGTAKTNTLNQFMSKFSPEEMLTKTITFSSLTTPQIFQLSVEGSVEKRQGRTFGPPSGKRMIVFIDDISMPAINDWGDQVTNEIVRQLFEQGGMYSLEKPGEMKLIIDTLYLAAMNQPGGGKNDIPNRLKRQFTIFNVPQPSVAAIMNIYGTLINGRFDKDVFSEGVCDVASKLVAVTIKLWNQVQLKMLPTPAKFHYLFNMRELSKVFQGVILASRDRFSKSVSGGFGGKIVSPEGYLLGLWRHESERVFADKLTNEDDKSWTVKTIMTLVKETFGDALRKEVEEPVYFVDFLREPQFDKDTGEVTDAHPSFYEAVADITTLRARVDQLQVKFNEESKNLKLELVLFDDALKHMMRIARLLCMARGSALLVGVGGSGKQSLTRLAAYIAGASLFQITITKTYNVANLFEDIKGMYKTAGFKGTPVAFIFTDAEVKDEAFLEYMNQILMTGEVAGLFPKDELDMIVNDMRPIMKKDAPEIMDTYENLYAFFLGRVRDNLHVCLCFSPVGPKFARRAMQFPGLINGCTIDWFLPWPADALEAVSGKFIGNFDMAANVEVKGALVKHMGNVHNFVTAACHEYFERFRRRVYVTPKSYLSFINGYKELYNKKHGETKVLADKINSGLSKLFDAKADVNKMKAQLAIKNLDLKEAQKVSEQLLKEISASTAVAEKEKAKVAVIVDQVSKKAAEIGLVKEDAEKDLAAAKPALESAVAALNSITSKDIGALKALKNPPDIVKRIFDTVLVLRQMTLNKAEWQDVKGTMVLVGTYDVSVRMMGDISFLSSLMNFPKEQINDETCELLSPYLSAPDYNYDSAKKASGNVAGLCNWCNAMSTYHNVAKVVEPKMATLRESEAELKIALKQKNEAEEKMAAVQGKLDQMQRQFDQAMAEKQRLEDDAAATQKKMDSANALITALGGEEIRWTQQSKAFADEIQRLTGDCALASSFVSYCGPFNKEFREVLLTRDFYADCLKLGVPVTENMPVAKFLVDDSEVSEWNMQGLPTDELSIQNGILVVRASRYPVLIDPQGQGLSWIKNREEANMLKVTSLNDRMFRNSLEDCLTFGKPMLIENIEEDLDPVLDPILEKRHVKSGKGFKIALADKEVDYTESFFLFCTTRLPNPHYTPELSAKVTVVDFTVTMSGLEDQLLGRLILKEKHELEEQRMKLLEDVSSYKRKIKSLEDDLLYRLSSSKGNLLDDTELIDVLADTKKTAQDVNEKLINASETNKKITDACEEYRPVAHRSALIYFLIAEFSMVNVMYQTSLRQYVELYELAIDRSDKAAMPSKRINNIIEFMTYSIYAYIQRGLFEKDKITFALMMTNKILVSAGKIDDRMVATFLKGGSALDVLSVRKKPKDWIPDPIWLSAIALSALPQFHDLPDSVYRNDGLWRQWYDQEAPERERIPEYEDRLTRFERMMIVKAFREDRTLISAGEYIADAIGQRFVDSIPLNMEATWHESHKKCPLICLLSPGADPTKLIEDLAKKKKIKVMGVSMGQGQEIIARKFMSTAVQEGQWVLLQNTHLGLAYLTELEQFMVKAEEINDDFRLWITAEPHKDFPIGLLQMGIKITNEAPVGMKAGLNASYNWVTQDMLDAVQRHEWRQLLFIMCFLHSIVQERRKFGPIGWNVPYEFNQSDLSACTQFLQNHLMEMDAKKSNQVTWPTVRYMISEIQYGGRITDDFDAILMDTYAEKYFSGNEMLANGYLLFSGGQGKEYTAPQGTEIAQYRAYIATLPSTESPEIFGLHPNADLTFRTLQVRTSMDTIIETMPKVAGASGGASREEVVDKICEDLLSKLPTAFRNEETIEKLKKLQGGPTAPLNVFLRQEIDRLNIIIALTLSTLKNLRLAIAGTIALSGTLIESLDCLFDARIPPFWLRKSWEAGTLGGWFTGMLQRFDQLSRWINSGRPKAFWLTGFFNPQGFLTAMKQEVNRKHKAENWALDDVVMTSEVTSPPKEVEQLRDAPSEGVYLYGLYLEGCSWSGKENKLIDSEPKKLFTPLPVLYVTGVQQKDKKTENVASLPCYRIKRRTGLNFITTFDLRSEDPKSKWILRGVGILCSID